MKGIKIAKMVDEYTLKLRSNDLQLVQDALYLLMWTYKETVPQTTTTDWGARDAARLLKEIEGLVYTDEAIEAANKVLRAERGE